MREEHRLRVFEDRVQSMIFGSHREERQETGENCVMGSFVHFAPPKILFCWSVKENKLDGAIVTYGGREKCIQEFGGEAWRKYHLEDQDLGGRIILKEILKEWESVCWTDNAQHTGTWRAVVNTSVNLRIPYSVGNFLTSWGTVSFSRRTLLVVLRYLVS